MTQYGSLVNSLMDGNGAVEPEVGMGVTRLMWSDRHPGTIVEVVGPRMIVVQWDHYVRTDSLGMSDAQSYEYSPNPDAPRLTFTLRKNGRWVQRGQDSNNGTRIALGFREAYYDYSF